MCQRAGRMEGPDAQRRRLSSMQRARLCLAKSKPTEDDPGSSQLAVKLDGRADRIESLAAAVAAAEDKATQVAAALEAGGVQHVKRVKELEATVSELQVRLICRHCAEAEGAGT